MKKNLSALLVVSCLLGLSAGTVSAQKRYKHLKHARTPEGRLIATKAQKSAPETLTVADPETLKPITVEAFIVPEAEPMSGASDMNLSASAAESAPEPGSGEVLSAQKLRRKAHNALTKTDKALSAMPFAREVVKSAGLEQMAPQKPQVDGKKFIIIGIILLGVAAVLGIVGLALSIALALSGTFPWTLIFNYIGLLLFFAGAALLTVGIIFRIKEKRAAK